MTRSKTLDRRDFLQTTSAGALAISAGVFTGGAIAAGRSANDKLRIACIGTANRAAADINGVQGENIVALCDIDTNYLDRAKARFKDARTYVDYREMIETEAGRIDAVVVGTADHSMLRHHCVPSTRDCTSTAKNL